MELHNFHFSLPLTLAGVTHVVFALYNNIDQWMTSDDVDDAADSRNDGVQLERSTVATVSGAVVSGGNGQARWNDVDDKPTRFVNSKIISASMKGSSSDGDGKTHLRQPVEFTMLHNKVCTDD